MRIELPTYLGLLLESFVRQQGFVPEEAVVVRSAEELALSLQVRTQNLSAVAQWRAWSDGKRVWLIVAQWLPERWQQPYKVALQLTFYDHDGVAAASSVWSCLPTGKWVLEEVVADADDDARDESCPASFLCGSRR